MALTVSLKNTEKVKARLERIKSRIMINSGTDVLRMWGLSAEAMAKALVPVDTGNLRSHIR